MTSRGGFRGRRRLVSAFGISLLAHIVALAALTAMVSLGVGFAVPLGGNVAFVARQSEPIDVAMIEPTVLNPYVTLPPAEDLKAEELKKAEEARKPEEERTINGQVSDVAKPDVEIRPDDAARFLGASHNTGAKETKGAIGNDKAGAREKKVAMVEKPHPATPPKPEVTPQKSEAPQQGKSGAEGKGALAMRAPQKPKNEPTGKEDGLSATSAEGTEAREGENGQTGEPKKGAPGESRPGVPGREAQEATPGTQEVPPSDLHPSDKLLSQALGVGSNDYLKDVDEGSDTLLNTKRWKYASFFTRVK